MAYKRVEKRTYKWPVKIHEPSADRPGEFDECEIIVEFKRLANNDGLGLDNPETLWLDVFKKIIVGWSGYTDEAGEEIPFSTKELERALADMRLSKGILLAWNESLQDPESEGAPGAAAKN